MYHKKIKLTIIAIVLCVLVSPFFGQTGVVLAASVKGKIEITAEDGKTANVQFKIKPTENKLSATGSLNYRQEDGSDEFYLDVVYLNADSEYAWFAGKCMKSNTNLAGRWLFVAVHDGGVQGELTDHIWWEWLDDSADAEAIAKAKAEAKEKPAVNLPIKSGDIVVDFY